MLSFFSYTFLLKAWLAGLAVALILAWLGTFLVSRKLSFIGDGLAHASLFGIALAVLLGLSPLPVATIVAIILAIAIYYLERKTKISGDMAIAIIFTTGMALGLILLHYYQGYQPELMSYLFGNILAISSFDFYFILSLSAVLFLLLLRFHSNFLFASFDPIGAHLSGKKPAVYDLLLYIMSAVAIIISIKLVGIILVSALLVIPSASSRLLAQSFRQFTYLAIIIALIIISLGLFLSFTLDWPAGATIVLTGTTIFILLALLKYLLVRSNLSSTKISPHEKK